MIVNDPRIVKQAKTIINHSLKVKKGEKVLVSGDFVSKPLILEIYKLLIKNGAGEVRLHFNSYELSEIFFKNATISQIGIFPQVSLDEIKEMNCYIGIAGSANTRGLSGIDSRKISARQKVIQPITDWRVEKTRWLVTRFPTEAQAQEADMSLSDYQNFVFGAINKVDWSRLSSQQEKLRKLIDRTDKIRIVGFETDLSLSVKGRRAVNAAGKCNLPDGEVFTSVIEDSAEGFIVYTYPAIYFGREFQKVQLEFRKGKVVRAKALKNESRLNKILNTDSGARFIGELGIGNNYRIRRFTKDILFDEKIGGSIHLALGRGYKETLSKNNSAVHWDMIKDLNKKGSASELQGGELWFDDKLVQKNGQWLIFND